MIEWEFLAPMFLGIVLILTVGGVLVLRPIAKHLGAYLEAATREKQSGHAKELGYMREILDSMNQRLSLIEERQDFTDRLLESGRKNPPEAPGESRSGSATPRD